MPKMSIKKKQISNSISRKKLFQFLFKNYIKSAYCGISKLNLPNGNELRTEYFEDMTECNNKNDYSKLQKQFMQRHGSTVIIRNSK